MKRLCVAVLALLLFAGCADNPFNAAEERRATAEERARFLAIYTRTAECLAMDDHGERVRWWIAKVVTFNGELHAGAQRGDDIWLHDIYGVDAPTVAHESMHHILERNTGHGDGQHTRPEWQTCGRYQ